MTDDAGIPDVAEAAQMDADELGSVLEALLLVVDSPVTVETLAAATEQPAYRIATRLQQMSEELTERDSGIDLRNTEEGWRMYTRARFAPYVEKLLLDGARSKLTRAALETLAVVAYRQPVVKADIDRFRGVDVSGSLRGLLDKKLIRIMGRKDIPGKPILYGTTKRFLEVFNLKDLAELPTLRELKELQE